MKIKAGVRELMWMAAGALVLLAVLMTAQHYRGVDGPARQLALQAKRVDVATRMRLALATAAEAEKSAVMAVTDADSRTYAEQARAATEELARESRELQQLLKAGGTAQETALLKQFNSAFVEFQRTDSLVLDLAVRNTNLKAYALAFGPAAATLDEMAGALTRLAERSTGGATAAALTRQALDAQIAALGQQTLLAPHIAEQSDNQMEVLEARMAVLDQRVRRDLAGLDRRLHDADLSSATAAYHRYRVLQDSILVLSHENTNVRSLALSLGRKRQQMFQCQDILSSLRQAILAEPQAGADGGTPSNPRGVGGENPERKGGGE